jgi:pyruvate/2-oxoglutarate dehydrogenase complex dihydrolipoamide acyltransferase (E2) component
MVAVGSELVVFDTDATSAAAGDAPPQDSPPRRRTAAPQRRATTSRRQQATQKRPRRRRGARTAHTARRRTSRAVMVSPARAAAPPRRARSIYRRGHGPAGRIEPGDIDSALAAGAARGAPPSMNARANAHAAPRNGTEEVKIIGCAA